MKKFYCFGLAVFACITAFATSSCSKNDEAINNSDTDTINGPDKVIYENEYGSLVRINNLLYELSHDGTCKLIDSGLGPNNTMYYSLFPTPIFNIPNEITIKGKTYAVTTVILDRSRNFDGIDNQIHKIECLSIPSNVLHYSGRKDFMPKTLIIGGNVRSVLEARAIKIIWLPNTAPSGYKDVKGRVQYASSTAYGGSVIVYPHLSSMFTVDDIAYVMTDPSERTCDLIGALATHSDKVICNGSVTKDGIKFSVGNILKYAFYQCTEIKDTEISNIKEIGDSAFYGCSKLSNLTLSNIKTIGKSSFYDCEIAKLSMPGTVTSIGTAAFGNCNKLSNVSLEDGDGILYIERPKKGYTDFDVFSGTRIKKLYIGRDLYYDTDNDRSPFFRLDTLEEVEIRKGETDISNSMFYGCSALKFVTIGDDITRIGEKAFSGCSSMTSFKFGKKLKSIGADAFSDCTALTSFTSEALTPPSCGNQALDDINKWECVLHVPSESIELYKTANQWKSFLKIE